MTFEFLYLLVCLEYFMERTINIILCRKTAVIVIGSLLQRFERPQVSMVVRKIQSYKGVHSKDENAQKSLMSSSCVAVVSCASVYEAGKFCHTKSCACNQCRLACVKPGADETAPNQSRSTTPLRVLLSRLQRRKAEHSDVSEGTLELSCY